ncbi:MAG TPA: hypothetical protein VGY98_18170 [Verrucomicrobiae bacterium]|nr:hypothetical protein [Verrucomicrobiae bacterium]
MAPNRSGAIIPAHLTLSPRVRLIGISTVCSARGVDAETVGQMVDDATHPRHIRFAFDTGIGSSRRELRFYVDEILDPALTRGFTIQDAIARILGGRGFFRRSEIEIAWTTSAVHISRLIKINLLKCEQARLLRSSLEAFLLTRWSGNNPT